MRSRRSSASSALRIRAESVVLRSLFKLSTALSNVGSIVIWMVFMRHGVDVDKHACVNSIPCGLTAILNLIER